MRNRIAAVLVVYGRSFIVGSAFGAILTVLLLSLIAVNPPLLIPAALMLVSVALIVVYCLTA